jgi:hypothetical protein
MPGLADRCEVCKQEFPFSLSRCGFCHKVVCGSCSIRVGGSLFCGRECGHAFFYGGDEDVDEAGSSETSEDE